MSVNLPGTKYYEDTRTLYSLGYLHYDASTPKEKLNFNKMFNELL